MLVGPRGTPETAPVQVLGSLSGCLMDGDAEQLSRERRVRRRALAISIVLQSAALTVLVLAPLFGKTERIAVKDFVPLPPYGHPMSHPHNKPHPGPTPSAKSGIKYLFSGPTNRPTSPTTAEEDATGVPELYPSGSGQNVAPACNWCVNIGNRDAGPRPPRPTTETHESPQVVHVTRLDPGMLIHRVEPVYPALARQIHREGRVELHALIGTDGAIQSLQIVAGDPLLERSAVEAVQQWRYRPTFLNGQPVEIDTYITVIYTMQH